MPACRCFRSSEHNALCVVCEADIPVSNAQQRKLCPLCRCPYDVAAVLLPPVAKTQEE